MEGMIGEVRAAAEAVFLSGDYIVAGMGALAVLIGVATMRNLTQIICASVLALLVLGLVRLAYSGATGEAPTAPGTYLTELNEGWASLGAMSGTDLLSYLIAFAVLILVLFIGKSIIFRD